LFGQPDDPQQIKFVYTPEDVKTSSWFVPGKDDIDNEKNRASMSGRVKFFFKIEETGI